MAEKVRLTPPQRKALEIIGGGTVYWSKESEHSVRTGACDVTTGRYLHENTVSGLVYKGFLERGPHYIGIEPGELHEMVLTDAGRAALAAETGASRG